MENTKVFIKLESPKDRDDFFEAVALYIMENVEESVMIKSRICSLAGYPEITAEEKDHEKQYMSRATESIASFFLQEIDEDKLSEKLAAILYEQIVMNDTPVDKKDNEVIAIYSRKALPEIKWEIFPGASEYNAARDINACIGLAASKGITLREFFRTKDHYKEMIVSLYGNPENYAMEITRRITEFFTMELFESLFIDTLVDSGDISELYAAFMRFKVQANENIRQNGKKIALAGAIIAIESAREIFGKTEMQEQKIIVLKEKLEELKKIAVSA